jgi:hypothetical protein
MQIDLRLELHFVVLELIDEIQQVFTFAIVVLATLLLAKPLLWNLNQTVAPINGLILIYDK